MTKTKEPIITFDPAYGTDYACKSTWEKSKKGIWKVVKIEYL